MPRANIAGCARRNVRWKTRLSNGRWPLPIALLQKQLRDYPRPSNGRFHTDVALVGRLPRRIFLLVLPRLRLRLFLRWIEAIQNACSRRIGGVVIGGHRGTLHQRRVEGMLPSGGLTRI